MENNKHAISTELVNGQPAAHTEDKTAKDGETAAKQNHHNSATYAASLWHSPVKHVKPMKHRGLDL